MIIKQTSNIIVSLQIEGIHNWPAAKNILPQMAFLSNPHRHIFYIVAKKTVKHDDRDVEIIQFKRELEDYFKRNYFNKELNICDFKNMSCEMLCRDLTDAYDLCYVSVKEDDENGSELYTEKVQ